MRGRSWLGLVAVAAIALPAREAYLARAPDVVAKKFGFRGDAARRMAGLLGLPAGRGKKFELDRSVTTELRVFPDRDRAHRSADGSLSSDLTLRASDRVSTRVIWDPRADRLELDGYFDDMDTAHPRDDGPRFRLVGPSWDDGSEPPAAWRTLIARARSAPRIDKADTVTRQIEIAIDRDQRARLVLYNFQSWNALNQPVRRNLISLELGPGTPPRRSGGGC